ncbi:hypothetical protein CF137_14030 [Aeromonas sobria]|nr:hypothetical protein CF137_14030 [Aeromonas sobria]
MLLLLALTVIHALFDMGPAPQRRESPYFFLLRPVQIVHHNQLLAVFDMTLLLSLYHAKIYRIYFPV